MSDEKKPGVKHVFDGIEEMDNRLPNWWLATLWGAIIFAFGYWFYYHPGHMGPSAQERYQGAMAEHQKLLESHKPKSTDDVLLALAKDPAAIAAGAEVFKTNCAACHGPEGQGLVGPNLTDKYWLHGGKPLQIQGTVSKGFVEKGMPAWEPVLGADRVQKVAAFVLSLKGKNVPGKAPQGEPEDI